MRYLKVGFAVFFVLLVSFFVVKSCVHPKRAPYSEEKEFSIPFFSQLIMPKHIVIAPKTAPSEKIKTPRVTAETPRMAIILDDWGKNYPVLQDAIDIHRPLTLAILPNLTKSKQIAQEAYDNHLGVMLHLPMEPKNKKEPLEPHTIMTTMSEAEILKCVDDAVSSIPHLEGVNNHMGSAATSDARVMKIVLARLKSKKLFFVDSASASTTQGPAEAGKAGIRFAKRDVFIDNVNKLEDIEAQLERAKRIALARGEVVVIGHDRKLTLQAIKEMVPVIEKTGIKLVLVKDVVKTSE